MINNKGIVYIFQNKSTFIVSDYAILESQYKVIDFKFYTSNKIFYPFILVWQFTFLILNWQKYQLIISQIAGYHTFLPSVLAYFNLKKHVIILHGTDCNTIPEIKYGNLQRPVLKWFTIQSIKKATLLLPVSKSLMDNNSKYYLEKNCHFGLKNNMPKFITPYKVVYNGVDNSKFIIKIKKRDFKSFITVAIGLEKYSNVKLKGVDIILDLAKNNPDYNITIIGSEKVYGYNNELKNVKIIGKIEHNKLCDYYNKHKYYFQLSISESFGLALCEAMLCGCIPIISNVGMMPEIIEDKGYILMKRDINLLDKLIGSMLLNKKEIEQIEIRDLIVKKYSINLRSEILLSQINHLIGNTSA